MVNIYIDNLPATEAQKLFNKFVDKEYLSNAECNYATGHNSSVRLECYDGHKVFSDLESYFYESR